MPDTQLTPPSHDAETSPAAGHADEGKVEGELAEGELVNSVREKLASTGYHQLLRVDVAAEGGHVRLKGRVGRYYLLQVAQQAALSTDGVSGLQNEIEVVRG
ncbi:MAG: BON domain-containing protein [Planctomycetota bacterium]|jgi:osmotically-inducible protein OsmY